MPCAVVAALLLPRPILDTITMYTSLTSFFFVLFCGTFCLVVAVALAMVMVMVVKTLPKSFSRHCSHQDDGKSAQHCIVPQLGDNDWMRPSETEERNRNVLGGGGYTKQQVK